MEEGACLGTELGTPERGVIFPLLSNVYLNELGKEWNERHASWGRLRGARTTVRHNREVGDVA